MDGPHAPLALRAVVVDADDLVRETLTGLLGIGRQVNVIGATGDTGRALRLVQALRPDVVVLDPRLPDLASGLAFIERVNAAVRDAAVLVIGSADVVEQVTAHDGVDGCVRKTFRPDELTAAILAAAARAAGRRAVD